MHTPKVVFYRPPGNEALHVSEDNNRSITEALNINRVADDYILPGFYYVRNDTELNGIPDVAMVIGCGNNKYDVVAGGRYYFSSLDSMERGIISFLRDLFPVPPKTPELNLKVPPRRIECPTCTVCGHTTVRNGASFKCMNCGEAAGCS